MEFRHLPSGRSSLRGDTDDNPSILIVISDRSASTDIGCTDAEDISKETTFITLTPMLFCKNIIFTRLFMLTVLAEIKIITIYNFLYDPKTCLIIHMELPTVTKLPRMLPRDDEEVCIICPPVAKAILSNKSKPPRPRRFLPIFN